MGSKLPLLAAQLIAFAAVAHAEKPADLMKKGIAAYKAGNFEEAASLLQKAYDLEPKPETLFALAQAERQAGHCDAAIPHYKQLLGSSSDLNIAKLVEGSLALCPQAAVVEPKHEPPPKPPKEPKQPKEPKEPKERDESVAPPKTITVTREIRHTDGLGVTAIVLGGIGLGTSGALFLASSSLDKDADHAATLDAYHAQHDRADRDRTLAFVAGGAGVALIGFAIYRFAHGGAAKPATEVAITPSASGGTFWVTTFW